MRVLVIEDDALLQEMILQILARDHLLIDVATDGISGLDRALQGNYDVAIIDWMLPGQDGVAICRAIRRAGLPLGILLLTARATVDDRVSGLDSGADDYLVKPFDVAELRARVRALGRRAGRGPELLAVEIRVGNLILDPQAHTARYHDQPLALTPREWNLLEYLVRQRGRVLTRQQILDAVWSYDTDVQLTMVDVYISYLRHKLARPGQPSPIQTIRSIGYRLRLDTG